MLGASYFGQDTAFCQSCFDRALLAIATLTADSGESTAEFSTPLQILFRPHLGVRGV